MMHLHIIQEVHMAKSEGVLKITGCHVYFVSDVISESVLDTVEML